MRRRSGPLPVPVWARLLLPGLALWSCGVGCASFPFPVGLRALKILQTVAFQNTSVTDIMEGVAFLGDVETHSYNSHTWKMRFLQPWARSSLTPQEWDMLEKILIAYFRGFKQTMNNIAVTSNVSYPFVVQSLIFCEIGPDGTKRGFYIGAVGGDAVVVFHTDNATWVAQKVDELALTVQDHLNKDKGTCETLRSLLSNQCINSLETFLQTGKATLDRQEAPVAVVFAQEPPGTNDSLLLVCRVTGFYPHPINVSWLQDEKALPSSRIHSTTILPNYDLTYQIRSSLAVKSVDSTHRYACKVQHSSLGQRSLVIPWERGERSRVTVLIAVLVFTGIFFVFAIAAVRCYLQKRRRYYEDISQAQLAI